MDDATHNFCPDEKGRLKSHGIRAPDPSKSHGRSGAGPKSLWRWSQDSMCGKSLR